MNMIIVGIVVIGIVGIVSIISDAVSDFKFAKEVKNDPNHWARVNHPKQNITTYVLSHIDSDGVFIMTSSNAHI